MMCLHVICGTKMTHSRFQGRFASFQDTQTLLGAFDEFVYLRLDDLSEIRFVLSNRVFGNECEVLDPQRFRYTNLGSASALPFRGEPRAESEEGRRIRCVRFV